MRKIAIFGGSFNPIHNGHIALAKAVREQCALDEVWLMVSPQNPLKQESDLLADELRFAMACKALKGTEGIKAYDYEMHLPKPSYTWTTLQLLQKDYPDYTFKLLIGGDNWAPLARYSTQVRSHRLSARRAPWHHQRAATERIEYGNQAKGETRRKHRRTGARKHCKRSHGILSII